MTEQFSAIADFKRHLEAEAWHYLHEELGQLDDRRRQRLLTFIFERTHFYVQSGFENRNKITNHVTEDAIEAYGDVVKDKQVVPTISGWLVGRILDRVFCKANP